MTFREAVMLIPLVIAIIWLGLFPQRVIDTASRPLRLSLLNIKTNKQ